jgi:hypothetical protein
VEITPANHACQKDYTLSINAAPTPQAWWTMDLGIATSETDSVSGLAMTAFAGAGFMSTVAGKVSNALQHAPTFGSSIVSRCINAALVSNGSGLPHWLMNTSDVRGRQHSHGHFLCVRSERNHLLFNIADTVSTASHELDHRMGEGPANGDCHSFGCGLAFLRRNHESRHGCHRADH